MEKKRYQLNIRTDAQTEELLEALIKKLGKSKTELIKLMVVDFALGYLTDKEMGEVLENSLTKRKREL